MLVQILQDLSVLEVLLLKESQCRWLKLCPQLSIDRYFGQNNDGFLHKSSRYGVLLGKETCWNLSVAADAMIGVFIISKHKVHIASL